MSALRISLPGQPVRLVDLGPAVGRTSHTRLQGGNRTLIAGELVSGASGNAAQQRHAEMKRIRLRTKRETIEHQLAGSPRETCGRLMPMLGEHCGRKPNHKDSCRSPIVMRDEAIRRRSNRPLGGYR